MPENDVVYVEGWKRLLPDYIFMLWNEQNFDINSVPFTRQVASVKKWGFIVDYIRAWAIFHYGGVYLDTDVEILKPLDFLLINNTSFGGFENKKYIAPGLIFAGEKGCSVAQDIMNFYSTYDFIQENGTLKLTPSPKIFTNILLKYGLIQNDTYQILSNGIFTAYPAEYFCPMSFKTGLVNITENTYSIHHYDASWHSNTEKKYTKIIHIITTALGENILSKVIILFIYFVMRVEEHGLPSAIRWYYNYVIKHI
jgi:mannosyltransferase OCH1-like enzyme